jgi:hypothetical protein
MPFLRRFILAMYSHILTVVLWLYLIECTPSSLLRRCYSGSLIAAMQLKGVALVSIRENTARYIYAKTQAYNLFSLWFRSGIKLYPYTRCACVFYGPDRSQLVTSSYASLLFVFCGNQPTKYKHHIHPFFETIYWTNELILLYTKIKLHLP